MSTKRTILVVDDTAMFRELGSVFLARFGTVLTAASGEQALALAQRAHPDVIVADLDMPGLDGAALCRAIRVDAALRETPVIAVTAGDSAFDRARAVRAGADDVVSKPISRMSLVESVRHYLTTPRQLGLARVDLETEVRIRGAGLATTGRSRNVSRGGIRVDAERAIPRDSEVELEFTLPEAPDPLFSTARIVWERPILEGAPVGMGLQFLAIDRESSRRIENFVYAHTRPPAVPLAANRSSAA